MQKRLTLMSSLGKWLSVAAVGLVIILLATFVIQRTSTESAAVPPNLISTGQEIDPAVIEAVRVARNAVIEDPEASDKWSHLGLLFAAHAFDNEAAQCFAEASRLEPSSQRWAYLNARCREKSAPEESLKLLEACIDLDEDPRDTVRLYLVEKHLENHRLDEAQRHLDQALVDNPENVRAKYVKAHWYFLREEYEACKNQILAANRDVKDRYEAEVQLAKQQADRGHGDVAKSILDTAKRRLQSSLCQQKTIGRLLAMAMMRTGDVEGSRLQQELANQQSDVPWPDQYTAGLSKLKVGLRTMLVESDIAFSKKQYEEAISILNRAVKQYPESLFARIRLGRTQIRLGRKAQGQQRDLDKAADYYKLAQTQLDVALSIDSSSVEAYFRRGVLDLYWSTLPGQQQRLAGAEEFFRKAILIKPDFMMAHYNLARCLDRQRKPKEAIIAMRETLKYDPNYLPAKRGLGGLLMKSGRLTEAVTELESYLTQSPNDKQARAWVERMRRDLAR